MSDSAQAAEVHSVEDGPGLLWPRAASLGALVLATFAALPLAPAAGACQDGEAALALGRGLYAMHCASCHGANLEGQPNWKRALPSGRLPAPPHDLSGHTWHHADGVLFRITKEGVASVAGGGYQSDMPAFADVLSDVRSSHSSRAHGRNGSAPTRPR